MAIQDTCAGYVINLRGLPFSTREEDISSLFCFELKEIHILFTFEGQPEGEAFIVVETKDELECALSLNRSVIGGRNIEVRQSSKEELEWHLARRPRPDGTLRLQGLPFTVTKTQIHEFFAGFFLSFDIFVIFPYLTKVLWSAVLPWVSNNILNIPQGYEIVKDGVGLLADHNGKPTGEAYVQFVSPDVAKRAAGKHKEMLSGRYVEISYSTLAGANRAIKRQMYINMGLVPPEVKPSVEHWVNPYWLKRQLPQESACLLPLSDSNMPGSSSSSMQLGSRPFTTAILEAAGLSYCTPSFGQISNFQQPAPHTPTDSMVSASRRKLHVRMRGLPFSATVKDVVDFFRPIQPVHITMRVNTNGKPNGMADVYFATIKDREEAMKRHKALMGFRYVELFSH